MHGVLDVCHGVGVAVADLVQSGATDATSVRVAHAPQTGLLILQSMVPSQA
jgi:hypothetical protein